jgi:hypothetical protein
MNVCTDNSAVEIFTDMPNDEYHRRKPGISRSEAARYRGVYGGRAQRYQQVYGKSLFAGNASTNFGTLIDGAIEAEARGIDWKTRCAVAPPSVLASDGSRRGKPFQEWKASLPVDAVECSAVDFEKAGDIIASIREHEAANRYLTGIAHTQLSVFHTDADGHRRKAKADGVTKSGVWFDLKTTSSEWRDLRYSFRRFAYDWQAAWYTDAAIAAGYEPFVFKFIVVQTFAPYDVKVLWLPEEEIERARGEIRETLNLMRHREETGEFVDPSYHEEQVLELG